MNQFYKLLAISSVDKSKIPSSNLTTQPFYFLRDLSLVNYDEPRITCPVLFERKNFFPMRVQKIMFGIDDPRSYNV